MRLKSLKLKNLWAVLVIAVVCGWIFSCDDPNNPFKTNLGGKVPIEPPTVTVTSPATGSFLKSEVTFEGKATAYRELSDVKIRIEGVTRTWVSLKNLENASLEGSAKEKTFTYTLNTEGLEDGFLRIEFQVSDPDFTGANAVNSVPYLYIIKNGPSTINMINPNADDLYTETETGEKILSEKPKAKSTSEIITGTKLLGSIYDRRGIKPGYPRIQIWKKGEAEPDPTDPAQWGVLFVTGLDRTDQNLWDYAATDLSDDQVRTDVSFAFRLSKFDLIDDPRDTTRKIIQYRDLSSKSQDFDIAEHYFRILTSDTFFEEDMDSRDFLYPRPPRDGENEIICYEPPLNEDGTPVYSLSYHTINVIPPAGDSTKIEIDNTDISAENLRKQPNIYIEREASEKIIVGAAELPTLAPGATRHADFRLRINAYREAGVSHATLEWSHPQKGRGFLPWDNDLPGTKGYVNSTSDTNKATEGHYGSPNPNLKPDGRPVGDIFQFTGINGAIYSYTNTTNAPATGEVFTSSSREYTLTVKVYVSPGSDPDVRTYYLALDEGGPAVDILDIKGKSLAPTGVAVKNNKGGTINTDAYTVNDNIQVSQYSFSDRNIRIENNREVKKWFVELAEPDATEGNDHLNRSDILLKKLQEYRSKPTTDGQDFLENYFKNDTALGTARARGWVDADGTFKLSVDTRTAYDDNGVKTGTNDLNGKYLWLYVVAQDGLYNLGYAMQKLYVDDSGDKPVVQITSPVDMVDTTGGIATPGALFSVVGGDPVRAKTNILGSGEGIDLSLFDDDGIRPQANASFPNDKLISITLESINFGVTGTVDISDVIADARVFELNDAVILGQTAMAEALIKELEKKTNGAAILADIYGTGTSARPRTFLPDGIYTLVINVPDAMSQKVSGAGLPAPGLGQTVKTIHFAVQSESPIIEPDIESALEGGFLSEGAKTVTGTVKSRLKISKLTVSFSPNVISPNGTVNPNANPPVITTSNAETLTLYRDENFTQQVTTLADIPRDEFGYYVYYWRRQNVNFDPANLYAAGVTDASKFDWRRIILAAWDGAGVQGNHTETVYVDATKPTVTLYAFNFGRTDAAGVTVPPDPDPDWNRVNGKVPIEIEANDRNGIGVQKENPDLTKRADPAIRWFIVPDAATLTPVAGSYYDIVNLPTNAKSGYFTAADRRGDSARYRTIVDTTNGSGGLNLTANGKYKVYVVARDRAGNESVVTPTAPLATFKVVQSTDDPRLKTMTPEDGSTLGGAGAILEITGYIFDDDGFNAANANHSDKTKRYVQILLPATWSADGTPLTWVTTENAWNEWPVVGTIDSISGYLKYTFDFSDSSARPPYLSNDGSKHYRLRVRDEVDRAGGDVNAQADSLGKYYPEGKNPDKYNAMGDPITTPTGFNNIAATTVYLPSQNGSYSFYFKNSNPDIWFNKYDPNDCHRLGHDYNPQHYTTPPPTPNPHASVPANTRPVYPQSGGATTLFNDLNGANSKIVDIRLRDATFTFSTVSEKMTLAPVPPAKPADGKTYTWSVPNAWLAPFTALGEGMHSVSIQASDDLGNTTVTEWSFAKDVDGPVISYDNVSASSVRTVSGEPGSVTITGRFTDLYSEIGTTFDYRFDNGNGTTMATTWTTVTLPSTAFSSHSAIWSVPVNPTGTFNGSFPDGVHKFQIRARDEHGHLTTSPEITFVIDRQAPSIPTKPEGDLVGNRMIVKPQNGLVGIPSNGYLTENQRVFSAATVLAPGYDPEAGTPTKNGDRVVFTLSGLVYEHNFNILRAFVRNGTTSKVSVTMTGIDALGVAWKNGGTDANWYGNGSGNRGITGANLRVKRAANGDFGLTGTVVATYQYRYVWELDVRERDLHELVKDGMDDDGIRRTIAISARDLALYDSDTEVWPFYLDSHGPSITFSNISASTTVRLEDTGDVVLKGIASDSTPIRLIQYKIEKLNYTNNTWTSVTGTAPNDFKDYTGNGVGTESRVMWEITDTAAIPTNNGDGQYRVTVRAYDWSLSATVGGNPVTTPPVSTFFVDRVDPAITWTSATQNFYKWNASDQISFSLSLNDLNTFAAGATGHLYPFNTDKNNALALGPFPVTITSPNAATSAASVLLTAASRPQGRYTLELDITDKSGRKASFNQTLTFYLDNTAPTIKMEQPSTLNPPTVTAIEAITGRVEFRGSFEKDAAASSVKRVAFAVTTGAAPTMPATIDYSTPAASTTTDTALKNAGWFFNSSATTDPWKLMVNTTTGVVHNNTADTASSALMEIKDGLAKATILLYDTRRFTSVKNNPATSTSTLLGTSTSPGVAPAGGGTTPPAGLTFSGIKAANRLILNNTDYLDDKVNQLRIHLLAIDEAGNSTTTAFDYYVYPAGDYPILTDITTPKASDTPANRQLNGTIKIQGTAEDNYRVSNVWFRVLKDGAGTSVNGSVSAGYDIAPLQVSDWDDAWEIKKDGGNTVYQTPQSRTYRWRNAAGVLQAEETSGGWYRANIGGAISKNVTWYAQFNSNGELDPVGLATSRGIIIQTIAEDTIWNDSLDNGNGGYDLGTYTGAPPVYNSGNLLSVMKDVTATVVKDAPTFVNERVLSAATTPADDINNWGFPITSSAVTGRSAYRVTVKHNAALGAIRWTNAPSASNVSPVDSILGTKRGDVNASYGIEASAAPKAPLTGTVSLATNKKYLIWAPLNPIPAGVPVPADENVRNTVFTPTAAVTGANIGTGVLLEEQADGTFEWLVTIDMDTVKLGFTTGTSGYYEINLEAHDNSKTVALFSRQTARIPIDNLPPSGVYTHSTSVAGSKATFGGDIGDSGAVKGLDRVVLWFSRVKTNVDTSIVWNENATTPGTWSGTSTIPATLINRAKLIATGVQMPTIPPVGTTEAPTPAQYSCVVIDRQDPMGNQNHHGHTLGMGWATGGALDSSWYVELDSTLIESGRVTAHFIVYDRAGNATYYNQRLMILNGVARISTLTLATDIYGSFPAGADNGINGNNSNLQLQTAHTSWGGTQTTGSNLKFGKNSAGTNNLVTANTLTRSAIDDIKARYNDRLGMNNDDNTDAEKGISQKIAIDTSKPGIYSVVFDEKDFSVRNNLFAVKVDTLVPMGSTTGTREKDRYYRVEYVSGAQDKAGTNANQTNNLNNATSGIRAGRVYIINNPGTNFPWGVLGAQTAQGETFQRGLAFLALQNGSELDLIAGVNYGNPSVWELNGNYYSNTGTGLARSSIPAALQNGSNTAANRHDVMYNKLGTGTSADDLGTTAEFVYRNAAFGANTIRDSSTEVYTIADFVADNSRVPGTPKPYPASATTAPHLAHSLFIIKVFDGDGTGTGRTAEDAEAELFGDFALLSVRVNNNDVTPPYAQIYDLNPKTEGVDSARTRDQALAPGEEGEIGANRTKGGLYNTTGNVTDIEKSGHIEPRAGTSLSNTQMGGQSTGTINRPAVTANAYFTVDTVSGDVIVRGYAEDNQRIARIDLEFHNAAAARQGNPRTILVRDTTNSKAMLRPVPDTPVQFTEKVELGRHRVEWAYLWSSEEYPGSTLVVGDVRVRAVAYNANSGITGTDPHAIIEPSYTVHTSATINFSTNMANRAAYDSYNPDYPASSGNFYRYNDIRVNLRPYITGFLRNSQGDFAHNVRSRQGWYILRRGETAMVTGFNLRNNPSGNSATTITLPGTGATRVDLTTNTPSATVAANYGISAPVSTRHRTFTVPASTAATQVFTGDGLVTLTAGGIPAVNTGSERQRAAGTPVRPLAIQPWNAEWTRGEGDKSKLWDDFTQVHIWQSNETNDMGDFDRARFAKGAFSITNPSMSIDPANGRLWASHQEGGRKPTQTGGSLYPGGGAYISNNSSTYPYENTDTAAYAGTTEGLRQVGSFSEHMTYTSAFVDTSSRVWAVTNSITKYNAADRWRFLPGMWLWGPVSTYDNYNGNPRISHFPRTTGTNNLDTTYHWFPFPNTGNGLTGMYAVESLWYNGGNNSRSIAQPQSTEQFHNPHVVAYTPATGTQHVHVSYYDSKDGSLKYRYNVVGTTGVVDTSASPRRWVNLDGGADVDDNSSYNEDQGQASAGNVNNVSYIGNYPAEGAVTPNGTGSTGVQVNSPYAGGTSYTRTTATKNAGAPTLTDNNSYIHRVLVQNGAYVTSGQNIYALGGVAQDSADVAYITAAATGFIVLNYRAPVASATQGNWSTTGRPGADDAVYRIYPVLGSTTSRIVTSGGRDLANPHNAGRHNAIAVTSQGFPVIAYYDETSQNLKIAVSNDAAPTLASNWTIRDSIFSGDNASYARGTGEYVSIQIDTRTGQNNRFHIAAMNAISKNVVYISGTLGANAATFAVDTVQVVDSVGNVGAWCKLSLTSTGEPWIAYMDDSYKGSRDGAKVAYRNATKYYKGNTTFAGQDIDLFGKPISGWETMHVPTRYRVEDAELGMERFPTIRTPTATRPANGSAGFPTFAAVGFLGEDYYRIAYYVE